VVGVKLKLDDYTTPQTTQLTPKPETLGEIGCPNNYMSINPLTWLADKILQARDARTVVNVLVHEAFIIGDTSQTPQYFVKVQNDSPNNVFTITHIWVKDGVNDKDILNPQRPLPHKLERSDIWETWFPKNLITDHQNVFSNVHVVLSNGNEFTSKKNITVRPVGFIAK